MKILVTGSSGFIGTFLVQELIRNGHQVVGLDICEPKEKALNYEFIQGDILNAEDVMKAASGADAIISLAAKHHDFGVSEEEFFAVNVDGTKNLLDCADKLGIKKFIFYSTAAVYGNCSRPASEDTPLNPVNFYGKSKIGAEEAIREWANKGGGRQAIIVRPVVVFGPNNFANMHKLIESIYKKRFFFVGKGDNVKSIAYVENLVDATLFLMDHMPPPRCGGGKQHDDMTPPRCGSGKQHVTAAVCNDAVVYNYVDYPQMTIRDTVNVIYRCLSRGIPKITIPLRPALAVASIFDILGKVTGYNFPVTAYRIKKFNTETSFAADKIRAAGFMQRVALEDGFRKMIDWYLSNPNKKQNNGGGEGEQ